MPNLRRLAFTLGCLGLVAPATAGEVTGRVTLGLEETRLADLGPTVVFLEGERPAPTPHERPVIRQHHASFVPEFLVVTAGQTVEMPNDDTIFHNVFSFSRPNDFDLGVYPSGESRAVTFAQSGLVKLYCSIHESMSGAVLVAPSPWFATASASGRFRIPDVPAGSYQLTVWNEKLPPVTRTVAVKAAGALLANVVLGDGAP